MSFLDTQGCMSSLDYDHPQQTPTSPLSVTTTFALAYIAPVSHCHPHYLDPNHLLFEHLHPKFGRVPNSPYTIHPHQRLLLVLHPLKR